MKKAVLFVGMISAAALLAGCTKTPAATQEVTSAEVNEAEAQISSEVKEAAEVAQAGVTSAIEGAVNEFADVIASFDEGTNVAFAEINGTTVLLKAVETFKDENDNTVSDDAVCYIIKDGAATECGEVISGGTAYPIAAGEDGLYTGNRAGVTKTTLADGNLVEEESDDAAYEKAIAVVFHAKEDLQ